MNKLVIYDCKVVLCNNRLKVYKDDKEILMMADFSTIYIVIDSDEKGVYAYFATASDIEIPYCTKFKIIDMSCGVANVDIEKLMELKGEKITQKKENNKEEDEKDSEICPYFYTSADGNEALCDIAEKCRRDGEDYENCEDYKRVKKEKGEVE